MDFNLLQAVLGGNSSPSADDINKILSSVGIEADSERVDALLKELEGKDITEVIASGVSKLASVPAGGGAMAASGGKLPSLDDLCVSSIFGCRRRCWPAIDMHS